jgi:MFS family permease
MDQNSYLSQLKEIQVMMKKSSRFLSLSGIAGICAGIFALIGVGIVYYLRNTFDYPLDFDGWSFKTLVLIALLVLVSSLTVGFFLAKRKSKRLGERVWNPISKQFVFAFGMPLITGGLFTILLIVNRQFFYVSPSTLVFYGLGLTAASNYTYSSIRYLGITFIILGLLNLCFLGHGLYFWATGFGLAHIIYGTIMHFYIERNEK